MKFKDLIDTLIYLTMSYSSKLGFASQLFLPIVRTRVRTCPYLPYLFEFTSLLMTKRRSQIQLKKNEKASHLKDQIA